MVLELIKSHLPTFVIGLIVGIVVTRLQVKLSLQKRDIGMVIDLAFIERNISQLKSLTSNLDKLVEQIKENGLELREQIKLTEDIEFKFGSLKGLKSPLSKLDIKLKPVESND
jgi:predicted transcriptional regulator